jgi:hypothetical protein
MTRARILLVVAVVLSAAHLFAGPPPNFIVLLADDLGWPMMNEPMDPALPSSCVAPS